MTSRRRTRLLIASVIALLALLRAAGAMEKRFKESDDLLLNPDCGWVAYNYEDSYATCKKAAGGREPFAVASVIYTRHTRKAWQDDRGSFENSAPLKLLEDWIAHRRCVAFRIYANRPDHLPRALKKEVPTVRHDRKNKIVRFIKYWDDRYVEDHGRLVAFLGERLGNSPHLAFVDIGGVGNTGGEWYFEPAEPFTKAGLYDDRFFQLVKTFVEMYRRAFPHTQLFISYECVAKAGTRRGDVAALLIRNKIGVRDDGLGDWPYPRRSPPLSAWPVPMFWPKVPVAFEGARWPGGVYGWHKRGANPQAILDWALEQAHLSYVNIGGAETASAKACKELDPLLRNYGRRLGYRFVLLKARYPYTPKRDARSNVQLSWANRGFAPCYVDRRIVISLHDPDGAQVTACTGSPEPKTTLWYPQQEVEVALPLTIPNEVPPGKYKLKIGMLYGDPRDPERLVRLANERADSQGRLNLGTVRIAR